MKQIDVSSKIMDRVVGFEKRRSLSWLTRVVIVVLLLGCLGAFFLISAFLEINELGSWDLLTPFVKDWQQATQIWQDLLTAFWNEIPRTTILIGAGALMVAPLLIIFKRKQIRAVINRLNAVWKYRVPKA